MHHKEEGVFFLAVAGSRREQDEAMVLDSLGPDKGKLGSSVEALGDSEVASERSQRFKSSQCIFRRRLGRKGEGKERRGRGERVDGDNRFAVAELLNAGERVLTGKDLGQGRRVRLGAGDGQRQRKEFGMASILEVGYPCGVSPTFGRDRMLAQRLTSVINQAPSPFSIHLISEGLLSQSSVAPHLLPPLPLPVGSIS